MNGATLGELEQWANDAHRLAGYAPKAYARRIVALALVGTFVLHSVWALSFALGLGLVATAVWTGSWIAAGLALPCFGFAGFWAWGLLRPDSRVPGVPLERAKLPKLFELIDDVARQLGAPVPTHVSLVPELNAHVQIARRARGEWRLALGLPLMLAEDLEQFKSTVGHELGHFVSGTAGARLVWAQQSAWVQTFFLLLGTSLGDFIQRVFTPWGQRFQAEAVAMGRTHERASDLAGAKVTSKKVAAEALIIEHLLERCIGERFWPQVWARAGEGKPPEDVFQDMRHFLEVLDRSDVDAYFRAALQEKTLTFDVHPCLAERVNALGERPMLPRPPVVSAARALLGDQLDELSLRLGAWWVREVKAEWEKAQEELRDLNARLAKARPEPTAMHPTDAMMLARALRRSGQVTESLPYYRRAVSLLPGNEDARMGYGQALLEVGDIQGLAELKTALSLSSDREDFVWWAFSSARRFLEARGQPEKNPFIRDYDRMRLRWGRMRALHIWGLHRPL